MTKLSESVTGKIKKEHVRQIPHWKFVAKHAIFWGLFGIAALVGAVAFSVLLFAFLEADFELLDYMPSPKTDFFLTVLPLFWLISFGLFFVIALYGLRHTKKGYRIPLWALLVGNLAISLILGTGSYAFGGAERFEALLAKNTPLYHSLEERRMKMWSAPERGLLAGKVLKVNNNTILILQDFTKTIWEVHIDDDAFIPPLFWDMLEREKLRERIIKVIGETGGGNIFIAHNILPWRRGRYFHSQGDMPELQLLKLLELRDAVREGDTSRVRQLQQELRQPPR